MLGTSRNHLGQRVRGGVTQPIMTIQSAVDDLDEEDLGSLILVLKLLETAKEPEDAVWFDEQSREKIADIRSDLQQ